MPRLAYLVSQFPTVNHTYLLREIRALRNLGIDLQVASIRPPDRPTEGLTEEELEEASRTYYVTTAGPARILRAHLEALIRHPAGYLRGLCCPLRMGRGDWRKTLSHLFHFVEAVAVGRWMERNALSHVHVHYASTVALIAWRVFGIDLSITFHGPGEFYDPAGFFLPEKISAARFVRAISKYGRSQLMRACDYQEWDKIEVAPLGVDPQWCMPRTFRANPAPFEAVCVGRLSGEKAQHVLIAALDRLVKQGRDVRLRLVGDGPDRRSLERDAATRGLAGRVIFEGWLDPARLRSVCEEADVFVLASFAEGLPVALMEAMAMEIPCVASRITGIPELILDGSEGLLVAASDDAALAGAIARLMDDVQLRRQLGMAARQRVLRDYDLETNVLLLAGIFIRRLGHEPRCTEATDDQQRFIGDRRRR